MTKKLLFIADSASNLNPAHKIAKFFRDREGWSISCNLVPSKAMPSERQIKALKMDSSVSACTLDQVVQDDRFFEFDVVVAFLIGSRLHSLAARLRQLVQSKEVPKRPILVTGNNGVVYEKHLEGLLWRIGCDVVCVNSKVDYNNFSAHLSALGHSNNELLRCGLILAPNKGNLEITHFNDANSKNILFAPQAVVPKPLVERRYILERLVEYARVHPDRKVIVKPRALKKERTFHVEKDHFEVLYKKHFPRNRPKNLVFYHGNLSDYFDEIGLLISVSSTAVLESLAHGVHSVLLSDLGIKESLGNHFFIGGNLLTNMTAILKDDLPMPNVDWLKDNGFHEDDSLNNLVKRVNELLSTQEKAQQPLEFPSLFYSAERAPYLFKKGIAAPKKTYRRPKQAHLILPP